MNARLWAEISTEPLSSEAIDKMCPRDEGYRLFPNRYAAGIRLWKTFSRPVRVYVLAGGCTYACDTGEISVCAGEFVDLPPNLYELVVSDASVQLVNVYNIPERAKE